VLYGEEYTNNGSIDESGGAGWQEGQEGTELGPLGYPTIPEDMDQLDAEASVSIPVGGTTAVNAVLLKFLASDADNIDTLTPEVEVRLIGTDFTDEPTHTGDAVNYSGTPVDVEVDIEGLVLGSAYHWQARVADGSGVYSSWVPFGGNTEIQADFTVTEATTLVLTPSVYTVSAGGYITLTVSAQDDLGTVDTAYDGTVHFTITDTEALLPADYTLTVADAGEHSFTNGARLGAVGEQVITVTDTGDPTLTGSATITVIPTNEISQSQSTVVVDPEVIEDNGEESAVVTITVLDDYNNPIIGKIISISTTGTGNNLIQPVEATDENGKAYGLITSTVAENKTISATAVDEELLLENTATLQVRDLTPPEISNIQVTDITNSTATVSWNTNELTTGQVEYGLSSFYGEASDYDNTLSTSHSITLTGLSAGSLYHFRILARDASLNETLSNDGTFGGGLNIESVIVSDITRTSAKIIWTANKSAISTLKYGLTGDLETTVSDISGEEQEDGSYRFERTIENLVQETLYYYQITVEVDDEQDVTGVANFTTLSEADLIISDIQVLDVTSSSARITFTTDRPAKIVLLYGITELYGEQADSDEYKTDHEFILTGLTPDTRYHFKIQATNQENHRTSSADQLFQTAQTLVTGGIFNVQHDREEEMVEVIWETTHSMTCHIEYGESPNYDLQTDSAANGTMHAQGMDISGLNDLEIHYRIVCTDDSDRVYRTRDLLYSSLDELPITGLTWYEHPAITTAAKYAVPTVGLVAMLLQLLNLIAQLGGLSSFISRLGMIFGAIFDKNKKKKGWGVIYNIEKKSPIPFAVVRLYDAKTRALKEETVSDLDGRYRFMVEKGVYTLGVSHPDFVFPRAESKLAKQYDLVGKYLGGEIDIKKGIAVGYDIPMITKERAKKGLTYSNIWDSVKVFLSKFGKWINIVSGVFLALSILVAPTPLNYVLCGINVLVLLLMLVVRAVRVKSWGRVYETRTSKGVSGAFVRLFDAKNNKLMNVQITDKNGRFGFMADKGSYLLTVDATGYEMKRSGLLRKRDKAVIKVIISEEKIIKQDIPLKRIKGFKEKLSVEDEETPFGA